MKILLREYDYKYYVWETAKYNNGKFYVNGRVQNENNIVSIMNDNRKNYVQCSCCGQVFRKGDKRFQQHKENAIKPETCFGCRHLYIGDSYINKSKFVCNPDGTFTEKLEKTVELQCDTVGLWNNYSINSEKAISGCKKRQCATAMELEIVDFFTQYPGAFDDIITIDSVLDEGYVASIGRGDGSSYDIVIEDDYRLGVFINSLGIVDCFYLWYEGDKHWFNYSKKYDELFMDNRDGYEPLKINGLPIELKDHIKNLIRKFYR
jgi:hypothetical protein